MAFLSLMARLGLRKGPATSGWPETHPWPPCFHPRPVTGVSSLQTMHRALSPWQFQTWVRGVVVEGSQSPLTHTLPHPQALPPSAKTNFIAPKRKKKTSFMYSQI